MAAAAAVLGWSPAAAQPRVAYALRQGKLFAPARIDGHAVEAMIDTGADVTVLDVGLARRAGIRARGVALVRGAQNLALARRAAVEVGFGGVDTELDRVLVVDFEEALGQPIAAALGRDILSRFLLDFDFDEGLISAIRPGTYGPPAGATRLDLGAPGGRPIVELEVEGGRLSALLDTGSEQPLILSPAPAERLRLLQGRRVSTEALGGYGRDAVAERATAASVRFGGVQFRGVPFLVAPRPLGVEAILGLPLLARFLATLDLSAAQLWLRPRPAFVGASFPKDLTGFSGRPLGEAFRVDHVARGGPAEAAGFRKGEVIVSVDGRAPLNPTVNASPPGTRVEFTLRSGRTRSLVLAEYY